MDADKRGYLYQRPSAFISGSKLEQLKRSPIQNKEFQPQMDADKRGYSLLYQRSSAFICGSKSSVIITRAIAFDNY
jgi:hypothetical protein